MPLHLGKVARAFLVQASQYRRAVSTTTAAVIRVGWGVGVKTKERRGSRWQGNLVTPHPVHPQYPYFKVFQCNFSLLCS